MVGGAAEAAEQAEGDVSEAQSLWTRCLARQTSLNHIQPAGAKPGVGHAAPPCLVPCLQGKLRQDPGQNNCAGRSTS